MILYRRDDWYFDGSVGRLEPYGEREAEVLAGRADRLWLPTAFERNVIRGAPVGCGRTSDENRDTTATTEKTAPAGFQHFVHPHA